MLAQAEDAHGAWDVSRGSAVLQEPSGLGLCHLVTWASADVDTASQSSTSTMHRGRHTNTYRFVCTAHNAGHNQAHAKVYTRAHMLMYADIVSYSHTESQITFPHTPSACTQTCILTCTLVHVMHSPGCIFTHINIFHTHTNRNAAKAPNPMFSLMPDPESILGTRSAESVTMPGTIGSVPRTPVYRVNDPSVDSCLPSSYRPAGELGSLSKQDPSVILFSPLPLGSLRVLSFFYPPSRWELPCQGNFWVDVLEPLEAEATPGTPSAQEPAVWPGLQTLSLNLHMKEPTVCSAPGCSSNSEPSPATLEKEK